MRGSTNVKETGILDLMSEPAIYRSTISANDSVGSITNDTTLPPIALQSSRYGSKNNLVVGMKGGAANTVLNVYVEMNSGDWFLLTSATMSAANTAAKFYDLPALKTKVLVSGYSVSITNLQIAFTS